MNNAKLEFEMKTHHLTSFQSELKGSKNAAKSSSLFDLKEASTGNAALTHPGVASEMPGSSNSQNQLNNSSSFMIYSDVGAGKKRAANTKPATTSANRFKINKHFRRTVSHSVENKEYEPSTQDSSLTNDSMHKFYKTRLKHSLINSFLFLIPIQNAFLFLITQFAEMDPIQVWIESITFVSVSLISIVLIVYLIGHEAKLKDHPVFFSLIIYTLITLNHIIPLLRSKTRHLATIEYGSFVIFNIVAIYSILPLPKKLTVLLSTIISVKNLVLLSFFLFKSKFHYTIILKKIVSYGIIYLMANVFGIYHQILTNISQEDAYKNTIKFLNGRMKLEKEKQQQELLMVSVLPAHIAYEMNTVMLKKTRKAQMKSMLTSNDDDMYYQQNEGHGRSPKRTGSFKKSAFSLLDSAARKLNPTSNKKTRETSDNLSSITKCNDSKVDITLNLTKNHTAANHQLSNANSLKKSNGTLKVNATGGQRTFVDKSRPKASGFHDLYIKAHNNVT